MNKSTIIQGVAIFGLLALVVNMYAITDFILFRPDTDDIVLDAGDHYGGFTFNGLARNHASPDQAIITYEYQTYYYQIGNTFKVDNSIYKIKTIALGKNSVIISREYIEKELT